MAYMVMAYMAIAHVVMACLDTVIMHLSTVEPDLEGLRHVKGLHQDNETRPPRRMRDTRPGQEDEPLLELVWPQHIYLCSYGLSSYGLHGYDLCRCGLASVCSHLYLACEQLRASILRVNIYVLAV